MSKVCKGCGSILQTNNISKEGYISITKIDTADYCERCYKIIHYGEFSILETKIDFDNLIRKINEDDNSAVIYLVDLLNMSEEAINYIFKFINKRIYVLLTRRDLIPKSVKDNKLITYFRENYYDSPNILCVSSKKNKNIDEILKLLKRDKVKKAYVVGATNSGKSTLINALLSSVGKIPTVTTSALPNTTANFISIEFDSSLTIIDTPGFVLDNSIYNNLKYKEIINLQPKKEIKVKTFQVKPNETIIVNDYLRIDYLEDYKNSFSFYMNNNLVYTRMKSKNTDRLRLFEKVSLHLNDNEDIVINGLGFIKVTKSCRVNVYVLDERLVSVRKNMI